MTKSQPGGAAIFVHRKEAKDEIETSLSQESSGEVEPATDEVLLLRDVKPGEQDKRGRTIEDVLWAVRDFKIYKTRQGISPHFSDDEKVALKQRESYFTLGSQLAHMNHLIHMLPRRMFRKNDFQATLNYYEREMACSVAQALTGDADQGKATLEALVTRLQKRLRNKGRVIYFAICLVSAFFIVLLASLFLDNTIDINGSDVALAAIMGSVGALLSTAAGLRNIRVDTGSTLFMNWVYGGQRMLVGVLGAIVLYLAVRAGVVLDLIPGATSDPAIADSFNPYELAFISVLAGFSERLVPNLLDRQSTDDSPESDTDTKG